MATPSLGGRRKKKPKTPIKLILIAAVLGFVFGCVVGYGTRYASEASPTPKPLDYGHR